MEKEGLDPAGEAEDMVENVEWAQTENERARGVLVSSGLPTAPMVIQASARLEFEMEVPRLGELLISNVIMDPRSCDLRNTDLTHCHVARPAITGSSSQRTPHISLWRQIRDCQLHLTFQTYSHVQCQSKSPGGGVNRYLQPQNMADAVRHTLVSFLPTLPHFL